MKNQLESAQLNIADRIAILPEEITRIIHLGFFEDVIEELVTQHKLTTIQQTILENETLLVLMLFLPERGFIDRIKESLEINDEISQHIAVYISQNIFALVTDILDIAQDQFDAKSSEGVSTQTQQLHPTETNTDETPSVDTKIPKLRTMKDDMEKIHGYGAFREEFPDEETTVTSSQDDLLKKQNLTETPTYQKEEAT